MYAASLSQYMLFISCYADCLDLLLSIRLQRLMCISDSDLHVAPYTPCFLFVISLILLWFLLLSPFSACARTERHIQFVLAHASE